jgi:spore coat polysaccharide biosynthesis protein SpsF
MTIWSEKRTTGAIIQARMRSMRLPGKVLADLAGEPMLARVYERTQRARSIEKTIVATSDRAIDDPIAALCEARHWACFRGNEEDCLDRYYQAALHYKIDPVVRITADCPCIDPDVIDIVVDAFRTWKRCVFATNRLPPPWGRTYPVGLDVEVCTFAALMHAWQHATEPWERESVMPYLYTVPGRFRIGVMNLSEDLSRYRWTVDTPEDLEMVQAIYAHFGHDRFTWREIVALLADHPEIERINSDVQQTILPVV